MSSVVGRLKAQLGLDATKFNRGMDKSQSRTKKFAVAVGRNMALAAAAITATAAASVGVMTRNSLAFVDGQAKMARSVDGTIDGLRSLQMAASDAGVSTSEVNKSAQMMSARLAEAALKGGASADALERVGLSAETLSKLDVDERVATIADRMKTLGFTSAQTSQFLMDMGVRSKDMALLMSGGGDAIRAARKEVVDLGLSLSEVDAAKVEVANDAMSRMKLGTEALGNRIAVAFAPALRDMASGFTEGLKSGGALSTVIDFIGTRVGHYISIFKDFGVIVDAVFEAFKRAKDADGWVADLSASIDKMIAPIVRVATGAYRMIGIFADLIRVTGSFGGAMAVLKDVASEVWVNMQLQAHAFKEDFRGTVGGIKGIWVSGIAYLAEKWSDFIGFIGPAINKISDLVGSDITVDVEGTKTWAASMSDVAKSAKDVAQSHYDTADALRNLASLPLASVQRLKDAVADVGDEGETSLRDATDAALDLGETIDTAIIGSSGTGATDAISKVEKLTDKIDATRDAWRGAFSEAVFGAKSVGDAIGGLLQKMASAKFDEAFNSLWSVGQSALGNSQSGSGGLGKFLGGLLSFDGGGLTPSGSRMGGLDGKGGFLAMMHPNEGVIDFTKGQSVASNSGTQEIRVTGGDLTLTDGGQIMARVQVLAGQSVDQAVSVVSSKMRSTKSFGQPA
ncbi:MULTISPECIES: hypothetical protein [Pacificibacter]|uniref:hypothetical protein n=1 Tax=Pacificibacter TaxID=1042323 RepID=UPI001C08C8AA|nr:MULTISPECIES: hypothetical protein [Pacificibacter]MBU2936980.1 hypothetical protein [Pacificibacter marinus]MDO6617156.1 hypothetical protein [Pacificibacter sp. 1_MG-2023]